MQHNPGSTRVSTEGTITTAPPFTPGSPSHQLRLQFLQRVKTLVPEAVTLYDRDVRPLRQRLDLEPRTREGLDQEIDSLYIDPGNTRHWLEQLLVALDDETKRWRAAIGLAGKPWHWVPFLWNEKPEPAQSTDAGNTPPDSQFAARLQRRIALGQLEQFASAPDHSFIPVPSAREEFRKRFGLRFQIPASLSWIPTLEARSAARERILRDFQRHLEQHLDGIERSMDQWGLLRVQELREGPKVDTATAIDMVVRKRCGRSTWAQLRDEFASLSLDSIRSAVRRMEARLSQ